MKFAKLTNMDEDIKALYEQYFNDCLQHIIIPKARKAAMPFLIRVPENYESASFRIMFCGQETMGWCRSFYNQRESVTTSDLRKHYNNFVNKGNGRNSPYWNFQKRIINQFPSISFVRNNIVKIGKINTAGCDEAIDELTRKYFPVFRKEVEILKPNLIIFMTGKGAYDAKIEHALGTFKTEDLSKNEHLSDNFLFELLTFADATLPPAIKINHPAWLQRHNLYWSSIKKLRAVIADYLKQLI